MWNTTYSPRSNGPGSIDWRQPTYQHSGRPNNRNITSYRRKEDHDDRRGIRLSWTCICVSVLLFLIVLLAAVTLGVFYLLKIFEIESSECNKVTYDMSMKFDDLSFSDALNDKTSPEYQQLRYQFCNDLTTGLKNGGMVQNECGDSAGTCDVNNFRQGSIIIDFAMKQNVRMNKDEIGLEVTKTELKEKMQQAVEEVVLAAKSEPGNTNIFKNQVSRVEVDVAESAQIVTLAQCPLLYAPTSSRITSGPTGTAFAGDTVVITCDPGFRVNGNLESQALTCSTSGNWNTDVSPCEVLVCPVPTNLQNKDILKGNVNDNVYKSEIVTQCMPGYSLDTSDPMNTVSVIQCQEDGTWDSDLQTCEALLCPDVTLPKNTTIDSGSLVANGYNNQITLSCDTDMEFESGLSTMTFTCTGQGQWDEKITECKYVKGIWSEWTSWVQCDSICTGETVNRTRQCINPPDTDYNYLLPCDDDVNVEYKQCEIDPTCVAVYASFTDTLETTGTDKDIVYDDITLDRTNAFDGTYFTAPEDGIYHFSLSTGATDVDPVRLELRKENGDTLAALGLENNRVDDAGIDTLTRNLLISLTKGTRVKVVLVGTSVTQGVGINRLTSVTVFSYTALMKDDGIVFMLGYTSDDVLKSNSKALFDNIVPLINDGNAFFTSTGTLSMPRDGIYFISITIFSEDETEVLIDFEGSLDANSFEIYNEDIDYFSLSRTLLLEFKTGDQVKFSNSDGTDRNLKGSDGLDTSLSGFLYEPRYVEPVAFFAVNTVASTTYEVGQPVVPFDRVMLDVGDSFFSCMLVCRVPGIYYFHFSTGCDESSHPFIFHLMKNDVMVAALIMNQQYSSNEDIVARSVVIDVSVGDLVYVQLPEGSYANTEPDEVGTEVFLGMLLQ